MGKRLTVDQSFKRYELIKAASCTEEAGDLFQYVEDLFLRQMDYDLWHEGQEDKPYSYPWTAAVADDLKSYGITYKGPQVFLNGKEVTYEWPIVYLDNETAGAYEY